MTDTSIIELYFRRSERAINESQASYGGYCYRVADGILRDARDSEEGVNDTWLAAWNAIPPTRPNCLKAYFGALTRRISVDRLRRRSAAKRGGGEALIALEELAECIPSGFSVERTIENKLLIQAFNAFLASQTEAERNLFVARVLVRPAGGGDRREAQGQRKIRCSPRCGVCGCGCATGSKRRACSDKRAVL